MTFTIRVFVNGQDEHLLYTDDEKLIAQSPRNYISITVTKNERKHND